MKEYKRLQNESNEELLFRLGNLRQDDGITWSELGEIMNELTGCQYTEAKWRKDFQIFNKMFNANQSSLYDSETSEILDKKMEDIKKERYRLFDQRKEYYRLLRTQSRYDTLNEIVSEAIKVSNLPKLEYEEKSFKESDNDLIIPFNDPHLGITENNTWNTYNIEILKSRVNKYIDKIIEIKNRHNSENAIVVAEGDFISGKIHLELVASSSENVVQQVMYISEIVSEFLSILSKHFKCVRFASVSGNHSRLNDKKDDIRGERLDDLVEFYIKARLQNFHNIIFDDYEKIDSTMYLIEIRGKNYVGVHGDYDKGTSNLLTLQALSGKKIEAVLMGHLHHNIVDSEDGIKLLMSGSFVGMDSYCIQKRIISRPEQMVTVVSSEGVICNYDIGLD